MKQRWIGLIEDKALFLFLASLSDLLPEEAGPGGQVGGRFLGVDQFHHLFQRTIHDLAHRDIAGGGHFTNGGFELFP